MSSARWSAVVFDGCESGDAGESGSAIGTAGSWRVGEVGSGFVDLAAEEGADQEAGLAGCATEPAVVADPHEAFGKDVGAEALEEGIDLESYHAPLFGGAVLIAELDSSIRFVAEDAVWPQGGAALTDWLTVYPPLGGAEVAACPVGKGAVDVGVSVLEGDVDAVAEAQGQGGLMDEEFFGIVGMAQGAGGGIKGDGGQHDVDVRVMLGFAAVGVEHGCHTESPAELGLGEILQSAGTLAQEQVVEDGGVLFAERPEGVRNGESDEVVWDAGQEARFLGGTPSLLIECPALRTVAMVATMVGVVLGVAVFALVEVPAHGRGAALPHGLHRPVVGGDKP